MFASIAKEPFRLMIFQWGFRHPAPLPPLDPRMEETASAEATIFGPRREKTCLRGFANNTGADQPAHPRRLISAFVIRVLKSTISKLATSEISVF